MYLVMISWQSIIAGTATALAISIVMAVLGVALGFTVIKPSSDNPVSGLGTAFGIWGVFSVLVSLASGGFVAGLLLPVKGAEHGFLVWAVVLIFATLFSGIAVGTAVRIVGSVVQGIGSGVASATSTVGATIGGGVAKVAQSAVETIPKQIGLEIDTDQLGDKIIETLKDTGIETLQPDFLQDKFHEVKADLRAMLGRLRFDSDNFNQVLSEFFDKQSSRFDAIVKGINRDAAVNALVKKRGMPKPEAQELVDNALIAYSRAVAKAKTAVGEAKEYIQEARKQLEDAADKARIAADKFSCSMARSALAAAVALILGAVVCMYAGHYGNRYSADFVVPVEKRALDVSLETPNIRPTATNPR